MTTKRILELEVCPKHPDVAQVHKRKLNKRAAQAAGADPSGCYSANRTISEFRKNAVNF